MWLPPRSAVYEERDVKFSFQGYTLNQMNACE